MYIYYYIIYNIKISWKKYCFNFFFYINFSFTASSILQKIVWIVTFYLRKNKLKVEIVVLKLICYWTGSKFYLL